MFYSSQRPQVCTFVKEKAKRSIWWLCFKSLSIPNMCFISNFIYFYTKKAYTIFRLLKMLFRLNFLVYSISATENVVPVEFLGVLCDGRHKPHVCAILHMCNACLLVSFSMGSYGSVHRYNDVSILCWWFGENIFMQNYN